MTVSVKNIMKRLVTANSFGDGSRRTDEEAKGNG